MTIIMLVITFSLFTPQDEVEEEEENGEARELYEGPDTDVLDRDAEPPTDKPRKTTKYMTKYERARVLGTRALQIRLQFIHVPLCA
jgi:DNA-directed RNA polymerase I, II, and III subunit RPABC2